MLLDAENTRSCKLDIEGSGGEQVIYMGTVLREDLSGGFLKQGVEAKYIPQRKRPGAGSVMEVLSLGKEPG